MVLIVLMRLRDAFAAHADVSFARVPIDASPALRMISSGKRWCLNGDLLGIANLKSV